MLVYIYAVMAGAAAAAALAGAGFALLRAETTGRLCRAVQGALLCALCLLLLAALSFRIG